MTQSHKVIFGTMRMNEIKRSISKWVYLFDEMYEKKILNFHISKEYESYNLFLKVYKKSNYKKKDINLYAKCFTPNFNEKKFEKKKLEILIDDYLSDFNINKINMQWMWRANIHNDHVRCNNLIEKVEYLDNFFFGLKRNKVKSIFCFPYSIQFGALIKKIKSIDGLAVYFNPKEVTFKKILGPNNIGIRPLYSGQLVKKYGFRYLMNFSLMEKKISKTIISINKLKNFRQLYKYLNV